MRRLEPLGKSNSLVSEDENVVIVDGIGELPDNDTYYSDYIFIAICLEGKAQLEYDGNTVTIQQGELFIAVPGSVLADYMLSPNFDGKIIAVKPLEMVLSSELHSRLLNSTLYIKNHPVARMTEDDLKVVMSYYNLICLRLQASSHPFYGGILRSLLNAFLLEVTGGIACREMAETEVDSTVYGDRLVQRFVQMVNENSGRDRTVEHYAERLNITPKYLSTLVRSSLDRTPSDVIRTVTLKEIERRLRYSDESIKQISNALNFPNTSFFGKYFKQHEGMTPMTFRKKYRK